MSAHILIDKMQEVQKELLNYLDEENDAALNFQDLLTIFEKNKIKENFVDLKLFLRLLINISNYHKRGPGFFNKIEQILNFFKEEIQNNFTNYDIFNFSKISKRILLYFIKEKMVIIDKVMAKNLIDKDHTKECYPYYFYPEIKPFINDIIDKKTPKWIQYFSTGIPENFEENRKIGENEHYICELIRKDLVDDFIIYTNKTNLQLDSLIIGSIYETHPELVREIPDNEYSLFLQPSLIEYAAFFGSIQIFQYLRLNGVEIKKTILGYAIFGNNPEIIHIIEEARIMPKKESFNDCLFNSIQCHHNEIANYLIENKNIKFICKKDCFQYYNFQMIQSEDINESNLVSFCKYDYSEFLRFYLNTNKSFDINKIINIQKSSISI